MQRTLARCACLCTALCSPLLIHASGLRVPVDNGLGAAGAAGGAALAEDASTGFTNPAGLVRIDHPELVIAVSPAFTTTEFKGTSTIEALNRSETGKAKGTLNVPLISIHYSHPLTERTTYGFSFNNPFGQSTNFEDISVVNTTVTDAMLITWNISNALGFKLNEQFSIGAGFDVQRLDFENENIFPSAIVIRPDFYTKNTAHDWKYGWHAGVLYQFNNFRSRIGFNYRSPISHKGEGRSFSTVTTQPIIPGQPAVPIGGQTEDRDFSVEFNLPPIFTLSGLHQVNEKWTVMGTVEYTKWSVYDSLKFKNIVNLGDKVVKQSFKNTWNFNAGFFYHWTEKFRLSGGLRYDQTPMNDKYRGVEFPDSNVWVLGMSGGYQFNKVVRFELGYSHSFFGQENINTYDEDSTVRNVGKGRLYGDVINTQLTINMAPLYGAIAQAI